MAYPDFINIGDFRIFNGPDKKVVSKIHKIEPGNLDVRFAQDFSQENDYYLAYQNHFKGFLQESLPYYESGRKLSDFNNFPLLADSINDQNLTFLKNYNKPLPSWFNKYERWRLNYNNGFRKYHVLFEKESRTGIKLKVDRAYYQFEKRLPIVNNETVLNHDYLWYAMFYLRQQALSLDEAQLKKDPMLYVIDSLFKGKNIGDVLQLKRLLDMSRGDRASFNKSFQSTTFQNMDYKKILDSLVYSKVSLPLIGKKSPALTLEDVYDNKVVLSSLAGKVLIINFWASWCSACFKEFPFENKLYNDCKGKGITVVNICVDTDKEKWKDISKVHNLQMINLYLEKEQFAVVKKQFDLTALPKTIILSKSLVVLDNRFNRASQITLDDIKQLLTTNNKY